MPEVKRISGVGQTKIYVGKCFRSFVNEKSWKSFISSAIIILLISTVTGDDMFADYEATKTGAFALVCACIWIGIFNSIQSICKERDIIKREHRTGLRISSYISAHLIYEAALCAGESLIAVSLTALANHENFPSSGVMLPAFIELMISFFIIIFASDTLGLLVSSIVKKETTAMTVMPFVLIIQLIMSGMIFELEGYTEIISKFTISKWGLDAICTTANLNSLGWGGFMSDSSQFEFTTGHLVVVWLIIILIAAFNAIISIVSLKSIDNDTR